MAILFLLPLLASAASEAGIPFSTLAQGDTSGVTAPAHLVIRSREAWQTLWTQHAMGLPSAPPEVDFSWEIVLAVFAGERRTGGYEVTITAVEARGGGGLVTYREMDPPGGSFLIQQLTHPYHLVKVPRVDGPIIFRRE
jgi:hypothetical protein